MFEELDYQPTPIGALSLRRRRDPRLGEVYEIKLGDEFLMTSAFTASEKALAQLALDAVSETAVSEEAVKGEAVEVAVGGLGLGYTAQTALQRPAVRSLLVLDYLQPVIDWHRQGLLPLGAQLTGDPRCRLAQGDFFALVRSDGGLDPSASGRLFHAILVDIDHSPEALLDPRNESFYAPPGLAALARWLHPGGVFGLWSNDRPDPRFIARLAEVFPEAWAEEVRFHNPLQEREAVQTVYLARTAEA